MLNAFFLINIHVYFYELALVDLKDKHTKKLKENLAFHNFAFRMEYVNFGDI